MHLSQNKFKRKDVGPWTWRENMELCSLSLLKTPQLALPPHLLVEVGWGPRLALLRLQVHRRWMEKKCLQFWTCKSWGSRQFVCLPRVITWWRLCWEAPVQYQADKLTLSSNTSLMFGMLSKYFIVGEINYFSWRCLHEGLSDNSTNGPIKSNVCWLICNLLNFWPPWTPYLWKDTEFDFEWSSIYLVYKMQPITVILSVNR